MIVATFAALTLLAGQQAGPIATAPANAAAPTTISAPPATTAAPAAAEPEQICRRQPIEGSRRQERVCHTKAEWDAIRANARNNQDNASRMQRDGS